MKGKRIILLLLACFCILISFPTKAHSNGGWTYQGHRWYYSTQSRTLSGWQKINGSWYYLGQSNDGAMKESCWIGEYYVGENGVWIPDYSETNKIKRVTMSMGTSSMFESTVLVTEQNDSIQMVNDFVKGLQTTQLDFAEPLMGGGYTIRLDFTNGTYRLYSFCYVDTEGKPIVMSNGKYYLYNEDELLILWTTLEGL